MAKEFNGGRREEENFRPQEKFEYGEFTEYAELHSAEEESRAEEYCEETEERSGGAGENRRNGQNGSSAANAAKGLHSLLATAVIAVVAVAAIIVPAFSGTDASAEFLSLTSTATEIRYCVETENVSDGDGVYLVVRNDFTERRTELDGAQSGKITGLKEDMSYTVSVECGKNTLAEQTIRTKSAGFEAEVLLTVNWQCRCGEDGYFYFRMEYAEEFAVYSDFSARLEDGYGNVSECVFAENFASDYTAEQKIRVTGALRGETATFTLAYSAYGEVLNIEQTVEI